MGTQSLMDDPFSGSLWVRWNSYRLISSVRRKVAVPTLPRIMERIAPEGDVYQAGTLAGNPLAMAEAFVLQEPILER